MSQTQLLIDTARALEEAGAGYLLSGSLASSLQGEPRATHDVDIVVEVNREVVDALVRAFGADDYYLDALAAHDALASRSMFNLIDVRTGDKVDFWALTDDAFDRSRFERRVRVDAFGVSLCVSTPEDTILQKLKWAAACGGSEKQTGDASGVYELQRGVLDEKYLDRWASYLGVSGALEQIRALAE